MKAFTLYNLNVYLISFGKQSCVAFLCFCVRRFSDVILREVCSQWQQHSQLLTDSDFALVEPILAARSVAQHTLMTRVGDPDSTQCLRSVLTDHLMELCRLARKAGNTQVCVCMCVCLYALRLCPTRISHTAVVSVQLAERAVFQMKQHFNGESWALAPVSPWQLEEAQVFWAKGEQGLALGLLRQMINSLEEKVTLKHNGMSLQFGAHITSVIKDKQRY